MIFFPAIDVKGGKCVRLRRGAMDSAVAFSDSPAEQAREFQNAGCEWIHLVDLDGAVSGSRRNAESVREAVRSVTVPVQLGGGIRDETGAEFWLDEGVARVILGTAAVENPALVERLAAKHPERIAVAIDARDGLVRTKGWIEDSGLRAEELAKRFENCGAAAVIYTDIGRDGTMSGPNVNATARMARGISLPVIASGGISSLEDLKSLRHCGASLHGAISGLAIYTGAFDVAEAVAALSG